MMEGKRKGGMRCILARLRLSLRISALSPFTNYNGNLIKAYASDIKNGNLCRVDSRTYQGAVGSGKAPASKHLWVSHLQAECRGTVNEKTKIVG
jgi:hypothetical protein